MSSYYAVIPATVRYDKNLMANAKLLYGEITALTTEMGYCYATNEYFANLYGVSETSVSKWVKSLVERKYITIKVEYDAQTKSSRRQIFLGDPLEEKLNDPLEEKLMYNITTINNTVKEKENINIKEKESRVVEYIKGKHYSAQFETALMRFNEMRTSIRKPLNTHSLDLILKDLKAYSGDNEATAIKILEKSITRRWRGVFALNGTATNYYNISTNTNNEFIGSLE